MPVVCLLPSLGLADVTVTECAGNEGKSGEAGRSARKKWLGSAGRSRSRAGPWSSLAPSREPAVASPGEG